MPEFPMSDDHAPDHDETTEADALPAPPAAEPAPAAEPTPEPAPAPPASAYQALRGSLFTAKEREQLHSFLPPSMMVIVDRLCIDNVPDAEAPSE